MNVLIAAGGAGQEVALAVLRLCYLAGLAYPRIIVFDSDMAQRQPDEGAESRIQALQALDQQLRDLGACDGGRLELLNPSTAPSLTQRIEKVEDLYSTTGNFHIDDKAMLSILLDSYQRAKRVDNGFHGEPAVGSLLFEGALARGTFRGLEQQLRDWAKSDKGLRVVLAGSVSGGVGTAVLPAISRLLERIKRDHPKVATLGVLQLPWFHLKRVDGDRLSAEPDVNAAQFDRNTACLVRGFLNDIEKKRGLDTLMLLGLPRRVERVSHGGDRQLETLHYLCVCAGIVTANLLDPRATRSFLGDQSHGLFGMSLRNSTTPSAFDGPPAGPTLYRPEGNLNIKQLIDIARSLRAYTHQFAKELECNSPTSMHHVTVQEALAVLETASAVDALKKTVGSFNLLHERLLYWLRASLAARVQDQRRADTLNVFEPPDGWDAITSTRSADVLAVAGRPVPWVAPPRRVLSLPRNVRPDREMSAAGLAWRYVSATRSELLKRV